MRQEKKNPGIQSKTKMKRQCPNDTDERRTSPLIQDGTSPSTPPLPSDIWILIFPLVPLNLIDPVPQENSFNKHRIRFWIHCRRVSKQWQICIDQTDFSFLGTKIGRFGFPAEKILKTLHFSTLELPGLLNPSWKPISDLSILTSVKTLSVREGSIDPDQNRWIDSPLTNLTSLHVIGCYAVSNPLILRMTHLRDLTLSSTSIRDISTLTCLQSLSLKHYSGLGKRALLQLTSLRSLNLVWINNFTKLDLDHLTGLTRLEAEGYPLK